MKMSFRKKLENYWFYYKWHTLGGIFFIVFIVIASMSYYTKVEPDIIILLRTTFPVSNVTLDKLDTAFQKYCKDYNSDKKIYVSVESLFIPDSSVDYQVSTANKIKLTADLVNRTSLIIASDKEYLDSLNPESFFAGIPVINKEGEKYILLNSLQFMADNELTFDWDIYLALREIPDKKGYDIKRFNDNKEFLENVINNNKIN